MSGSSEYLGADFQADASADRDRLAYYLKRKSGLEAERSTFRPHWMELTRFISPRSGRYFWTDVNRGDKRYNNIYNTRATMSWRNARSGLFAGLMSPSQPWFKLETPDPDLMAYEPVAEWLYKVEQLLYAIAAASNLYNMAPTMLGELLLFGTGAMSHMDDFDNVATFFQHTIGSYSLAQNSKYQIDTICREYQDTVKMLVETYPGRVSRTVQGLYDRGNYEAKFPVMNFIEPNRDYDPRKRGSQFKKYRSVTIELAGPVYGPVSAVSASSDKASFLSDKGFDEFPSYCPRWDVTGEDTYATDCPGMTTLGDVKGLMALERQSAKANDKMVDPPLHGPATLRNIKVNSLPGGVTLYDGMDQQELKPIYTVMPQMDKHLLLIQAHEARIKEGFYEDLWRSLHNLEGVQPQNEMFLSQKQAEDMLMLGPVLEHVYGDFLIPLVNRLFNQALRAGLFTGKMQPPPELSGAMLKVRFISTLAQAQKAGIAGGIEKVTGFVAGLVKAGFTHAADNVDVDESVRQYNRAVGAPPNIIMSADVVAKARQEQQEQQAQAQQMQQATQAAGALQQGAQGAATLAQAPGSNGQSLLTNIAGGAQQAPPL